MLPLGKTGMNVVFFVILTIFRSLSQLSLAEKFGSGLSLGPGQLYLVHTPGQMEMLHQTLSLSKALVETGTLFKQQVL